MRLSIKATTPEKILELLKLQYTASNKYIIYLQTNNLNKNNKHSAIIPFESWKVHELVRDDQYIASYFSPDLSQKSARLAREWEQFVNELAKESYFADSESIERQKVKPWDDTKDLHENLYEKENALQKFPACIGTSFPEPLYNRVHFEHVFRIATHPNTLEVYQQKKNLEERMIECLAPSVHSRENLPFTVIMQPIYLE